MNLAQKYCCKSYYIDVSASYGHVSEAGLPIQSKRENLSIGLPKVVIDLI